MNIDRFYEIKVFFKTKSLSLSRTSDDDKIVAIDT